MRILLISFTLFISITVFAQFDRINLGLVSSEQEFIKSALDSAVFILRQDYVLIDTLDNSIYKQDNKEYFGRFYCLAILIDSVLITTNNIFEPYKSDTAYHYYKRRYGWKAELTDLSYRPIYSNNFFELEYELHNHYISDSIGDSLFIQKAETRIIPRNIKNNSLQVIENTSDDVGWAFMIYADQNINICDTCDIKYAIFKAKPDFENIGKLERQTDLKNVIGGFYIIPEIIVGQIRFNPAGFIEKNEFWFVKTLTNHL